MSNELSVYMMRKFNKQKFVDQTSSLMKMNKKERKQLDRTVGTMMNNNDWEGIYELRRTSLI
jgi:hypothetical protein